MGKLITSPLTIRGELHDVHLFNFSVTPEEMAPLIPHPLQLVRHEGRAWISVVDVQLKKMRPAGVPKIVGLNYHHIAYRALVECPVLKDSDKNSGETEMQRGIYFLESFSNNPLICLAGNLMSEYRFLGAQIQQEQSENRRRLECQSQDGRHRIAAECQYDHTDFPARTDEIRELVGPLKQAFSVIGNKVTGNKVTKVQIARERWPLEPVHCHVFQASFFKTAQFEACFRVRDVIHYTWHKASEVPARWTS